MQETGRTEKCKATKANQGRRVQNKKKTKQRRLRATNRTEGAQRSRMRTGHDGTKVNRTGAKTDRRKNMKKTDKPARKRGKDVNKPRNK